LSRVRVFSHRPSLLILPLLSVFFFNDTATTEIYTLSLHDALPISMNKKGILVSDLPGPAQGLEAEASKALGENDLGKAYFAAAQLSGQVDAIQINRPFIQAKIARIQEQMRVNKPDEATQKQLSGVLTEVIQKFGD